MDTQEDILAIYIWLMHLPTFKKTLSFLCETIARKKDLRNILLLQTKDKYKVERERCPNLFLNTCSQLHWY